MSQHQPIVEKLKDLLNRHQAERWSDLLAQSVIDAQVKGYASLPDYFYYLDDAVQLAPSARNVLQQGICEFYWFLDQPTGRELQKHKEFRDWMFEFANDWGKFLDTPASLRHIDTFMHAVGYHMDEYAPSPSGWMSFNQWFAREVKPGLRPVEGLCDDSIVVAPADTTFVGQWEITDDSKITAKDMTFSVIELLDGSPDQDKFRGGTFIHAFLNVNDYHRYHVPVAGKVKELRDIPGAVYLDVTRNEDGTYNPQDGTGYQFTQARGLIVQQSPIGLVATLPIGMAQVSSCVLTAAPGSTLHKGQEFGYFQFGGSDIIVLFEKACNVEIVATPNIHYNQGVKIGVVKK